MTDTILKVPCGAKMEFKKIMAKMEDFINQIESYIRCVEDTQVCEQKIYSVFFNSIHRQIFYSLNTEGRHFIYNSITILLLESMLNRT
jgi:hypothetical protein